MMRCISVVMLLLVAAVVPASAQVSFVGDWSGRYHEDQPDRVPARSPVTSAAYRSTKRRAGSATPGTSPGIR